jgi:hypothetical protein
MATILKADLSAMNGKQSVHPFPAPNALRSPQTGQASGEAKRLPLAAETIAPEPGSLVYLFAERLASSNDDFNPCVFSAIDACTCLQVARLYMTWTFASAVDMLSFAVELYPFKIRRVRTLASGPFYRPSIPEGSHEFARIAEKHGINHSLITDPVRDDLFQLVSKFGFHGLIEGRSGRESELRILKSLADFLFFHNNQRSLPTLAGRTPLEKLHSFVGYDRLRYFDPFVSPSMLTKRLPVKT